MTFRSVTTPLVLLSALASACGGVAADVTSSPPPTSAVGDAATPSPLGAADGAPSDSSRDAGGSPPPVGALDAAAPSPGGDASAPSKSVRIIVEPSDNGQALLQAIQGAKTSIHMTMYLVTSTSIVNALIAAKGRSVSVKVVLNATFPNAQTSNAQIYQTLTTGGVAVVWASSRFTYTHEKCFVIDGRQAWIMSMNATQTSARDNREYLAVDEDAADVAEAEAIFQADFTGAVYTPVGNLVVAPTNARDRLVALISSAHQSVDVEGEEFSDTSIVAALTKAAKAGMRVRLVVADGNTNANQSQAIASVKLAGVTVVATSTPYIHAKAIVVDGARAYVGSENFSTGSLVYNRELGVLVGEPAEVAKVANAIQSDFAAGVRQ